jgi:hypothetical protein
MREERGERREERGGRRYAIARDARHGDWHVVACGD